MTVEALNSELSQNDTSRLTMESLQWKLTPAFWAMVTKQGQRPDPQSHT